MLEANTIPTVHTYLYAYVRVQGGHIFTGLQDATSFEFVVCTITNSLPVGGDGEILSIVRLK
jgi:hypothetical protein